MKSMARKSSSVISNTFLPQHQQSSKKKVPHLVAALAQIEQKVTAPSSHQHLLPLPTSKDRPPWKFLLVQNELVVCRYARHLLP